MSGRGSEKGEELVVMGHLSRQARNECTYLLTSLFDVGGWGSLLRSGNGDSISAEILLRKYSPVLLLPNSLIQRKKKSLTILM